MTTHPTESDGVLAGRELARQTGARNPGRPVASPDARPCPTGPFTPIGAGS